MKKYIKNIKKKMKKAQSIIEYLGVATVFTAAGILFFTAANRDIIIYHAGLHGEVQPNSLIGNILGPNNNEPWPDTPEWSPNAAPVEIELEDPGYCYQLTNGKCTDGRGTQGQEAE
ncbi:MAG: hypothetical protein JW867_05530 [Candidatus Omnitrophica bacterium]|nr:hypothetical protein [Candidatus Omnitrophota bacterium]